MFTVYILKLKGKKRIYIGVTEDLGRRVLEHRLGKVYSTRGKFEDLVHIEHHVSKKDAWLREKWLKSGKGRDWIKQNLFSE